MDGQRCGWRQENTGTGWEEEPPGSLPSSSTPMSFFHAPSYSKLMLAGTRVGAPGARLVTGFGSSLFV
jgi:hypothetical protein